MFTEWLPTPLTPPKVSASMTDPLMLFGLVVWKYDGSQDLAHNWSYTGIYRSWCGHVRRESSYHTGLQVTFGRVVIRSWMDALPNWCASARHRQMIYIHLCGFTSQPMPSNLSGGNYDCSRPARLEVDIVLSMSCTMQSSITLLHLDLAS